MEKLPTEKKKTIWERIKAFFKIGEKVKIDNNVQIDNNEIINKKEEFENDLKVDTKNNYLDEIKKDDFLKKIEKTPTILDSFPIEKLKVIENYYSELIILNKKKLEQLNQENK